jgi:hypothetical protein
MIRLLTSTCVEIPSNLLALIYNYELNLVVQKGYLFIIT